MFRFCIQKILLLEARIRRVNGGWYGRSNVNVELRNDKLYQHRSKAKERERESNKNITQDRHSNPMNTL